MAFNQEAPKKQESKQIKWKSATKPWRWCKKQKKKLPLIKYAFAIMGMMWYCWKIDSFFWSLHYSLIKSLEQWNDWWHNKNGQVVYVNTCHALFV